MIFTVVLILCWFFFSYKRLIKFQSPYRRTPMWGVRPFVTISDESGRDDVMASLVSPFFCCYVGHSQFSHALSFTKWLIALCLVHWNSQWYTGLFKMIVGILTTCHTQYTWDRSMCSFYLIEQHSKFLLHTVQVLYMCTLCDSTNINTIIEFVPNCL